MSDYDANLKKVYSDQVKDLMSPSRKEKRLFRKIRRKIYKNSPVKLETLKPKIPSK